MFIPRILDLKALLDKKSFFLFGPRATGKSSLIRQQFSAASIILIDLLRTEWYLHLSSKPQELGNIILAQKSADIIVVIDEIQRIPLLLNEVHRLIEERHIRFLLTGSSARKLRQGQVNWLAGRAWEAELFPLTSAEIRDFNLERYLQYGGLPPVVLSKEPEEELYAYVHTYLREEIQAEALVRKIPAFSQFLQVAALTSGEILNFSKIASDIAVPVSTVREYYKILEDTFIGFLLPGWTKTQKRKAMTSAKFYFFDLGVSNILANIKNFDKNSERYGRNFEHFMALELRAFISYQRLRYPLCYWRSRHGHEVDFIIDDRWAIEIKSTDHINTKHLKGLQVLGEEGICEHYILVSQDPIKRRYDNIVLWPWQEFLSALWQGEIIH